jgi:hypothetical protein
MTLTIECKNFTATPIEGNKLRLDIQEPVEGKHSEEKVYEAQGAIERLGQLLSRTVTRKNLAYWRRNLSLPHTKLGPKKFTYQEEDLVKWVKGRSAQLV